MIQLFSLKRILQAGAILLALISVYLYKKTKPASSDKIKGLFFAVPFAIMQYISMDLDSDNLINEFVPSAFLFARALLVIAVSFVISFCLSSICFGLVEKGRKKITASVSEKQQPSDSGKYLKKYFSSWAKVFACWLPYFILFFPGTSNHGDTEKQLRMFFHREVGFPLTMSPVQGPDIFISDHHPYFTTWLYGTFTKLGLDLTGHAFIGVAIFSFLQLLLFAGVLVYFWVRFLSLGISDKIVKRSLLFTALFPFFPIFSVCMVKDMTFAFFCLTTMMLLFEILITNSNILNKWYFYPLLSLSTLLMMMSKGQGKYFAYILLVVLILSFREKWLQLLPTFIIPILFYQLIWQGMLLPSWNIAPAGKQETLGILFQQTARYVSEYENEMTPEEIAAIDRVLPYETIVSSYDPLKSDKLKWTFRQNCTSEDILTYTKYWFSMLLKHPGVYFAATLNTSYKFFDITWQTTPFFTKFNSRIDKSDEIYIYSFFTDGWLGDKIKGLFGLLQKIPVLGLLFSVSFYTWLAYFAFLAAIGKNKDRRTVMTILPFLSVLVYFACPVSLSRYAQPLIMMTIPMMIGVMLPDKANK